MFQINEDYISLMGHVTDLPSFTSNLKSPLTPRWSDPFLLPFTRSAHMRKVNSVILPALV